MIRAAKARLLYMLFGIACAQPCFAGLYRMESETWSSLRNGDDLNLELPMYELMSASYVSEQHDLEMNTNFAVSADGLHGTSNTNLYVLDLKYELVPDFLTFRFGRSFDPHYAIGLMTSDSVAADLSFFKHRVHFGSFYGYERKFEDGNVNPYATVYGAHLDYVSGDLAPTMLSTKFQQRSYNKTAQPVENLLQFTARKPFAGSLSPEALFDVTQNLGQKNLDRAEVGFDLYPSMKSSARIRGMTYNVLANTGIEQPIFSIFSAGRLYEGRMQLDYRFSSKVLSSISAFYDDYLYQSSKRTHGYGSEFELRYFQRFMSVGNTIYFFKSYGGDVIGDRIQLQQQLTDRLDLSERADLTHYEKITSSRRYALSTYFGLGSWLGSHWKLNTGAEFNSNNILRYDFRAVAKLTFLLWQET